MGAGQGVILIMSGVLVLYLLWAAKSPLNAGGQQTPQNPPGTPPNQVQPPGSIQVPPIQLPTQLPDPTDPCNPIYQSIWGPFDCENKTPKEQGISQ